MGVHLDDVVRARLTEVLARQPTTEPELRRLAEEADACERLLAAQLERRERRLDALAHEPSIAVGELADELRAVREIRDHLAGLRPLLAAFDDRARELRASWVGMRSH